MIPNADNKSINHKGGRALRNSPVGYFIEGARLQCWYCTKFTKGKLLGYLLCVLCVLPTGA
jgi:hypothetical protein